MIDLFGLDAAHVETFLLIFLRVSTMLFVFPFFSAPQVPHQMRLGLGAIVSLMLYRFVPTIHAAANLYDLVAAVVSQLVLGIIVGFVASLVFTGIQFAGEILDLLAGFAVASVINPTTNQQVTIIGEFQLAMATLVFLAANGHHMLMQGIAGSFSLAPLPFITLDPSVGANIVAFLTQALTIVFKIAAPAAVALFLTNVALAFMARVAPQMNVFVVGFPLQVSVGLIMVAISLPLVGTVGITLFNGVARQMDTVLRGLH